MKYIQILLILIFTCNLSFSQQIKKVKIDDVIKMIDTATAPLAINFWASWCHPCVEELPWFEKTIAGLKDQKVKLILVSLDFANDYPKKITNFVKKKGYKSTVVWLDETNANEFCLKIDSSWMGNIPVTIMVNNRKQYRKFYGQQLNEESLKQALQKLIE